ncbi:MAG: phosphoadenylyl-sulfate reductase [Acidobacteria bacterium]|nr:MAG: phosphoadenylyl-sulfate reductase [Acidobacteriota bacterium]PYR20075.1 MAG: phosphoadenylyl-sulfate reductase [Acidobacteriota bacterium]PYR54097.1 MAG: phosphoadenylyl-sulfate reductase [Acidobacteriota bacterium]
MTAAQTVAAAVLESSASPCMTCSFQAEDVVALHMLLEMRTGIEVLFLDTVHHFEQTYAYRDKLAQAWGLRLVNLRAARPSPGLWQTSTDACCAKHKVEPLFSALESYDAWFTGLRREQSPSRANLVEVEPFTLPSGKVIRKISPLARWSMKEVWDYARANEIPLLPLYEIGYTSIGCEPCTSLPLDPSNPRSGRWHGQKLECGIHVQPAAVAESNKS